MDVLTSLPASSSLNTASINLSIVTEPEEGSVKKLGTSNLMASFLSTDDTNIGLPSRLLVPAAYICAPSSLEL
jgi:hypothetical protein